MAKLTCINGSARNNGSCNYLIDRFIGEFADDTNVVKYCVGDADLHFCKGCKKCYVDGKCVQNDDAQRIVEDILSSDIVVIAAPSYWADVPAQLKTLFDRTTPYGDTNPNRILSAQKQITGIAIAVRAGIREQENSLILNSIEHYFGHLGIKTERRISITQTDKLEDLLNNNADDIERVVRLAKDLSSRFSAKNSFNIHDRPGLEERIRNTAKLLGIFARENLDKKTADEIAGDLADIIDEE